MVFFKKNRKFSRKIVYNIDNSYEIISKSIFLLRFLETKLFLIFMV